MILTLRWKYYLFGWLIGQNSHDNACVIQREYRQVIWEQSLQCGREVKQVLRFLENMLRDPALYLPLQKVIFVWTVLKAFEQVDCISDFQLKKTEGHYAMNHTYLMYLPTPGIQILSKFHGFTSPLRQIPTLTHVVPGDSPNCWRANANAGPTARIHPRQRKLPLSPSWDVP